MKQKGATQRLTHISEKVQVPCFQKHVQDWAVDCKQTTAKVTAYIY